MGYFIPLLFILGVLLVGPVYLLINWISPDKGQSPQAYDSERQHNVDTTHNKEPKGLLTYNKPSVDDSGITIIHQSWA